MAFSFDGLTKKAKDIAALAADKTKDAADQVKVNVAIAGEQREMDKSYRAIGEWFVNEYEGEIPEAVKEMVDAVNACKAKIAELEALRRSQHVFSPVRDGAECAESCRQWKRAVERCRSWIETERNI